MEAGNIPSEEQVFGAPQSPATNSVGRWLANKFSAEEVARACEAVPKDENEIVTVAVVVDSDEAMATKDFVALERRTLRHLQTIAGGINNVVQHAARARTSDGQVTGLVLVEIKRKDIPALKEANGVRVLSLSLDSCVEYIRFKNSKAVGPCILELYRVAQHAGIDISLAIDLAAPAEGDDMWQEDVVVAWLGTTAEAIGTAMEAYRAAGNSLQHLLKPAAGQGGQSAQQIGFKTFAMGDSQSTMPEPMLIDAPMSLFVFGVDPADLSDRYHPTLAAIRKAIGASSVQRKPITRRRCMHRVVKLGSVQRERVARDSRACADRCLRSEVLRQQRRHRARERDCCHCSCVGVTG